MNYLLLKAGGEGRGEEECRLAGRSRHTQPHRQHCVLCSAVLSLYAVTYVLYQVLTCVTSLLLAPTTLTLS